MGREVPVRGMRDGLRSDLMTDVYEAIQAAAISIQDAINELKKRDDFDPSAIEAETAALVTALDRLVDKIHRLTS